VNGFYDIDPDVLPADVAIGEEVVPVGSLPGETRARIAAMLAYFSDLNEEDPLAFEGVVRHVASHGMDLGAMPEVIAIGNDRVRVGSRPRRTRNRMAALLEYFSDLRLGDPVAFEAVVRYVALCIESPGSAA
jgi:hypothetical protein